MNKSQKGYHLMVFFTYGNSLQTWAEAGLLGRELLPYKKMIKHGWKISFFTYGDNRDYKYMDQLDGIKIVPVYAFIRKNKNRWMRLVQSFFIPFDPKVKKWLSAGDIYKTNQMSGAWMPLIAGLLHKKPLVIRCGYEMLRNMLRNEKNGFKRIGKALFGYLFELIAYLSANKIIISSKSDKEYIKKLFPVQQSKLHLIRNFIDTDLFSDQGANPLGDMKKKILFIGRLEDCKNIHNLIKGVAQAGFRLDIIGKGTQEDTIKEFVAKNRYDVHFLGTFDNQKLPATIIKYDLFLLPSLFECSPKVLLEAMSCGRIVVGTDVDGIRELIENSVTGFLCNIDANSIAESLRKAICTDKNLLNRIGQNARNFILQECTIDRVYKREIDLYSRLLS